MNGIHHFFFFWINETQSTKAVSVFSLLSPFSCPRYIYGRPYYSRIIVISEWILWRVRVNLFVTVYPMGIFLLVDATKPFTNATKSHRPSCVWFVRARTYEMRKEHT